jgi:hypothetical protein
MRDAWAFLARRQPAVATPDTAVTEAALRM